MTTRMMPPDGTNMKVGMQSITINGRLYKVSPGGTVDVNDIDAGILALNGWIPIGQVGTTAQRPSGLAGGLIKVYVDTTLNKPIFHDGNTWRDHTGTAV